MEEKPVRMLGIAGIVNKVLQEYQYDEDMLIQIFLKLQRTFGWITREMLSEASLQLGIPLSRAYSIATFYKAFSLSPRGKNLIRVCMGTSCKVRGSSIILDKLQSLLGIKPGEITPDLKFSLETVNCLGCCALGPVMVVGDKYHGHLDISTLQRVFKQYW
jgi:NADH-quinone oxidoreductase subunit E